MKRKVALITGAASGIGQALAVAYARHGVAVVGGYYPADPHDPQTTVTTLGERTVFTLKGRTYPDCTVLPKKRTP